MKIRTLNDLSDRVDLETIWGKRELSTIRMEVGRQDGPAGVLAIRSGVTILYAHWEGWIKAISRLYLDFVNTLKIPYRDLSPALLATALRARMDTVQSSNKALIHLEFAEFIRERMHETARVPSDMVRTDSNLSSAVLSDILCRIGIPERTFATKYHVIDKELVHRRNTIAHGEFLELDREAYLTLHDQVRNMLFEYTNRMLNNANDQQFRAAGARTGPQRAPASEDTDRSGSAAEPPLTK